MSKAPNNPTTKTYSAPGIRHIDEITEKTIDFVELIFDDIIDNENLNDSLKILLLRLQIPLIKASILDQTFLADEDHPARVLLNTIADTNIDATIYTDDAYTFLDKIISNILSEYELSAEIFQIAIDDFKSFVTEQNSAAIVKQTEAEEKKVLLRKFARAATLKSLRTATTGKILPEAVHSLILKRWPTLMFNHYILHGHENNEWTIILLTLRQMINSVQPITTVKRLKKIRLTKDELFKQIEQQLYASNKSINDTQDVISAYKETVHTQIDNANLTNEQETPAKIVTNKTRSTANPTKKNKTTSQPSIPENIKSGMWFQLYMGKDKAARRCKLSVVLANEAKLMFVNHKGELVAEKSFAEFNVEIAAQKSKEIIGHSAFENTLKAVTNPL